VLENLEYFGALHLAADALADIAVLAASVGAKVTTISIVFRTRTKIADDVSGLLPAFFRDLVAAGRVLVERHEFAGPPDGL